MEIILVKKCLNYQGMTLKSKLVIVKIIIIIIVRNHLGFRQIQCLFTRIIWNRIDILKKVLYQYLIIIQIKIQIKITIILLFRKLWIRNLNNNSNSNNNNNNNNNLNCNNSSSIIVIILDRLFRMSKPLLIWMSLIVLWIIKVSLSHLCLVLDRVQGRTIYVWQGMKLWKLILLINRSLYRSWNRIRLMFNHR